ncbi:MAG: chromosome segregation protein SMC [Lactobacillus sp.]|jgi:chromosome segregation protein|nr:chromosome segregation protein SMC [Lactobacillus sp.]MCH4068995.1 chromosome segregation protein SMC [Lactobacillus sp.]MCI1303397.1 chromosome segregation protein SMC [Lactobacillus sp.]MCI1329473.1 chromosome segregation protein SMC [Lactobacillus sp.]MCI1359485.1 chromosome segregation protein SMC [Lactobacillus sp.]
MPLKQIILSGFKSFADRTVINLAPGVTGIVGPNGSGKSNITEAVRWVMGEGSAKALRGQSMQDVIFGGSVNRHGMNHASVTLVFDNQRHELAWPGSEVTITRRLLKNGDASYLINGKQVRLKDVRGLFLSGNLSAGSLAIISQGRVDQVLDSKPEARRSIFEEAAGVLHFKEQKHEAVVRLKQTNENLVRIHDLLTEVQARVEPLAQQSSAARDYQFEQAKLAKQEQALLALEIADFEQQLAKVKDAGRKSSREIAEIEAALARDKETILTLKKRQARLQDRQTTAQAENLQLTKRISGLSNKIELAKQTGDFNRASRQELSGQVSALTSSLQARALTIKQNEQETGKIKAEQDKLQDELEHLQAGRTDPEVVRQKLTKKRQSYLQHLDQQSKLSNQIVALQTNLDQLKQQRSSADQHRQAQAEQLATELAKQKQTAADLTKQIQAKKQQLVSINQRLAQIKQSRQTKQADLNRYAKTVHSLTGQLQVLQGMSKRHQGYYYGVRYVLNHLSDFTGILGAVGDLIRFDSRYEAALKTALGSGVQNLIAKDRYAARDAIKRLKADRAGRASFLPLDNLRVRKLAAPTRAMLKNVAGFIAVASELVEVQNSEVQPAIDYLLGTTIVVDTIASATSLSQRVHSYRIVTLDGDIISPGGLMTGGSRSKQDNSPLAVTSQLTAVNQRLQAAQAHVPGLQAQLGQLVEQTADCVASQEAVQHELQNLRQQLTAAKTNQSLTNQRLAELQNAASPQVEQQKMQTQLRDLQTRHAALLHLLNQEKQDVAKLSQELKQAEAAWQTGQEQVASLQAKLAVIGNKLANNQRYNAQLQAAQRQEQEKLQAVQAKLAGVEEQKDTSLKEQAAAEQELKKLQEKQASLSAQLAELSTQLGKLSPQLEHAQASADEAYEHRQEAADKQEQLAVKVASLQEKQQQKLESLQSKYQISFSAVMDQLEIENTADNLQKLQRQVRLHEKTIAEIGPVNLQAIEEYQTVKERRDFLQKQEADLLTGRGNLQATMAKLDQTVAERFSNTFAKISASFAKLFPIVFGGGKAQLKLTDPDTPLTTGIEVSAQPPGKRLQELSLLSGGERALTAITLLFAILEVKPVPFCILDEVEAALDDPNVDRFGKFLHRYAAKTQFIVITHRRGTMVQADQLCGVVMQESGVSQVLTVSLQQMKDKVN